jgi:hypothetical protein
MYRERYLPPEARRFWTEAQGCAFHLDIDRPSLDGGLVPTRHRFVVKDLLLASAAIRLYEEGNENALVLRLMRRRDGSKVFFGKVVFTDVSPRLFVLHTGALGMITVTNPARTLRVNVGIPMREIQHNRAKRALVEQLLRGLTTDVLRHVLLPYLDPIEGVNLREQ